VIDPPRGPARQRWAFRGGDPHPSACVAGKAQKFHFKAGAPQLEAGFTPGLRPASNLYGTRAGDSAGGGCWPKSGWRIFPDNRPNCSGPKGGQKKRAREGPQRERQGLAGPPDPIRGRDPYLDANRGPRRQARAARKTLGKQDHLRSVVGFGIGFSRNPGTLDLTGPGGPMPTAHFYRRVGPTGPGSVGGDCPSDQDSSFRPRKRQPPRRPSFRGFRHGTGGGFHARSLQRDTKPIPRGSAAWWFGERPNQRRGGAGAAGSGGQAFLLRGLLEGGPGNHRGLRGGGGGGALHEVFLAGTGIGL